MQYIYLYIPHRTVCDPISCRVTHHTFFLKNNKLIFVHLINTKQKKKKRREKSNPISKSISETLCHSWTTLSCETIAIQHVWLKSYGVVVFVSASSGFQQLRITN